jgi:hypothetical protein
MPEKTEQEWRDLIHSNTVKKLNPGRFPGMSGKMAAILGAIFGEEFTNPRMASVTVTSDGFLLGMNEGDIGYNEFLGSFSDLERNYMNLIDIPEVGLTPVEYDYAKGKLEALKMKAAA